MKANLLASALVAADLTQLSSACMLRHPHTDFGFPRWNNSLFSSQDQYHPNPTWQRRKLVLPWSGLNRRALLFYSTAHLNKGRGLSVPTPGSSSCHCHYHHEYLTLENKNANALESSILYHHHILYTHLGYKLCWAVWVAKWHIPLDYVTVTAGLSLFYEQAAKCPAGCQIKSSSVTFQCQQSRRGEADRPEWWTAPLLYQQSDW